MEGSLEVSLGGRLGRGWEAFEGRLGQQKRCIFLWFIYTESYWELTVSLEISDTLTVSLIITDQVQELDVLDVPFLLTWVLQNRSFTLQFWLIIERDYDIITACFRGNIVFSVVRVHFIIFTHDVIIEVHLIDVLRDGVHDGVDVFKAAAVVSGLVNKRLHRGYS